MRVDSKLYNLFLGFRLFQKQSGLHHSGKYAYGYSGIDLNNQTLFTTVPKS